MTPRRPLDRGPEPLLEGPVQPLRCRCGYSWQDRVPGVPTLWACPACDRPLRPDRAAQRAEARGRAAA